MLNKVAKPISLKKDSESINTREILHISQSGCELNSPSDFSMLNTIVLLNIVSTSSAMHLD